MDAVGNNEMYIQHTEDGQNRTLIESASERLYCYRINKLTLWQANITNIGVGSTPIMCSNTHLKGDNYSQNRWSWIVYRTFLSVRLNNNFSMILIESTSFPKCARCNIRTTIENGFKWVYKLNFLGQTKFNILLQMLVSYVCICYEITILNVPRSGKAMFMKSNKLDNIITDNMAEKKRIESCLIILLYLLRDVF